MVNFLWLTTLLCNRPQRLLAGIDYCERYDVYIIINIYTLYRYINKWYINYKSKVVFIKKIPLKMCEIDEVYTNNLSNVSDQVLDNNDEKSMPSIYNKTYKKYRQSVVFVIICQRQEQFFAFLKSAAIKVLSDTAALFQIFHFLVSSHSLLLFIL